ncbi:MAG: DUF2905 domain-containing protein [Candidatus Omnitrophica bacterium]|nr:DUF2905 domain-containing protein [Candidatus Omnitrophota bacterium]
MTDLAKILIVVGAMIISMGLVLLLVGKIPGVGKLPGDFFVKKDNFIFYVPLTTCIILSLLLSFILWIFNRR